MRLYTEMDVRSEKDCSKAYFVLYEIIIVYKFNYIDQNFDLYNKIVIIITLSGT